METTRSKAEDRALVLLEKLEARAVEGIRRVAEKVDAWLPEATTLQLTERLPGYADRGVHVAERELDHEYRLVKRVLKNQRMFLKEVARAMAPHTPARPARKPAAKTAA
jgi:hypothetical protein